MTKNTGAGEDGKSLAPVYLVVVTTAFQKTRIAFATACINHLAYQFSSGGYKGGIVVVCQSGNEDFNNWNASVTKCTVEADKANIGAKLNAGMRYLSAEYDYFVYVHDDMLVHDPQWLPKFTQRFEETKDCGQLGLLPHSQKGWLDGVFFTSAANMRRFGLFDENFIGDGEMQDYAYRMRQAGLKNEAMPGILFTHVGTTFTEKGVDMDAMRRSRVLLRDRWLTQKAPDTGQEVWV